MVKDRAAWNEFYRDGSFVMVWPSEPVVRFVRRFKARHGDGCRALDLGCGNGRHLFLLAREGYDVLGCDLSETAVQQANDWLVREGFEAAAQVTQGGDLPYESESLDIVLSYGVLDSMMPETAQALVAQAFRCLKPGGELFLTLRASADRDYGLIGKVVAPNTVEVTEEIERGTLQHFFDLGEVQELVADFELLELDREDRTDWLKTGRKYSRWEVRARKPDGKSSA